MKSGRKMNMTRQYYLLMKVLVELHHRSPFPLITRLGYLEGVRGQLTWDLIWRFLEARGGWCGLYGFGLD
jgi:hypothetical protein